MNEFEKAATAWAGISWGRVEVYGGYPDDWRIIDGKLYVATLDGAKEYQAPLLEVWEKDQFIEEFVEVYEEWHRHGHLDVMLRLLKRQSIEDAESLVEQWKTPTGGEHA